jgi:hypothetical protein
MPLWKLYLEQVGDINEFVECWEEVYTYIGESNEISEPEFLRYLIRDSGKLSQMDIMYLFRWKSRYAPDPKKVGKNLLGKRGSWALDESGMERLTNLRSNPPNEPLWEVVERDLGVAFKTSPIKNAFLCHIISYNTYPIWDQHAFRAYLVIANQLPPSESILKNNLYKIEEYQQYRNWFNNQAGELCGVERTSRQGENYFCPSFRRLDQALWAFGKFISQIGVQNWNKFASRYLI